MTIATLRSSVRPVLAYLLAGAFVVGFFLKMIPSEVFTTVASSVISFWYAQRVGERRRTD